MPLGEPSSSTKQSPSEGASQGRLHGPIPQTVNDGVEEGGHHGVGDRDELVPLQGVAGFGPQVHEGGAAVVDNDHREV